MLGKSSWVFAKLSFKSPKNIRYNDIHFSQIISSPLAHKMSTPLTCWIQKQWYKVTQNKYNLVILNYCNAAIMVIVTGTISLVQKLMEFSDFIKAYCGIIKTEKIKINIYIYMYVYMQYTIYALIYKKMCAFMCCKWQLIWRFSLKLWNYFNPIMI